MTRAERRHRMERAQARASRLLWVVSWLRDNPERAAEITGKAARTRKPCSDWCCGNPRRHFKDALTMQERRAS